MYKQTYKCTVCNVYMTPGVPCNPCPAPAAKAARDAQAAAALEAKAKTELAQAAAAAARAQTEAGCATARASLAQGHEAVQMESTCGRQGRYGGGCAHMQRHTMRVHLNAVRSLGQHRSGHPSIAAQSSACHDPLSMP